MIVTEFQALITGAVQGALMKAGAPGGFFAIEVEPVTDDDGYTNQIRVRGKESGEVLLVKVEVDIESERPQ